MLKRDVIQEEHFDTAQDLINILALWSKLSFPANELLVKAEAGNCKIARLVREWEDDGVTHRDFLELS